MQLCNMKMERHEIDIDNFIKEKIRGFYPRKFAVEPAPDFAERTMTRICHLEERRRFAVLCGWASLWAFGPLVLRELWLLIRRDYFAAGHLPFSSIIISVYQFFLSWAGALLLLAMGISVSLWFVLKLHRSDFHSLAKIVKA